MAAAPCYVGCAGWSLPRAVQRAFGAGGSHLQRYATQLNACEINSSFHRAHSAATYRRWAESTPEHFRFSVKLPKAITHERKLLACEPLLGEFIEQAGALGTRLGCLLVQLPPSLAFDAATAGAFLTALRRRWDGPVAAEPRHASWFGPQADAMLAGHRVARVLADPVRQAAGATPGGWQGLTYLRLHGSPRMYYSAYEPALIATLARRMAVALREGTAVWCVFDNTAAGAAADNALGLKRALDKELE
ncbi:MAG: hypothetical protein JWQ07_2490 [Ramlibacter sp.]|nr:hypothetical protein [Ramlibacter sp.]